MANTIADLQVRVGGDVSGLDKAMSFAHKQITSFGNLAGGAAKGVGSFFGGIMGFAGKLGMASLGVQAITGAVGGLVTAMTSGNAEMEDYNTQFTVLTGSAQNAAILMDQLKLMGAKTPFTLGDLAGASQTLLAFGTQAKDIQPTLQMLGDVSSGNADKLKSLTLAFGQISSTGHLMGQDLLQLINAGFNPLQVISQKTGRSMGDLKEDMSKGLISFDMVKDAFKTATSAGGQFNGMMEKQSHTFSGMASTLQDNLGAAQRELFAGVFDVIKGGLEWLVSDQVQSGILSLAHSLGEGLGNAAKGAASLIGQLGSAFGDFSSMMSNGEGIVSSLSTVVGNLAGMLATMFGATEEQATAFAQSVGSAFGQILEAGQSVFGTLVGFIQTSVIPVIISLAGFFATALPVAIRIGTQIFETVLIPVFTTVANIVVTYLIPAFTMIVQYAGQVLPPIISALAHIWEGLSPIISAVASAFFAVLPVLLDIGRVIAEHVTPILTALGDGLDILKVAWEDNWGGMRSVIEAVGTAIGATLGFIKDNIGGVIDVLKSVFMPGMDQITQMHDQLEANGRLSGEGFNQGIMPGFTKSLTDILDIKTQIETAARNMADPLWVSANDAANAWNGTFFEGIAHAIPNMISVTNSVIAAADALPAPAGLSGYDAGYNYSKGLLTGVNANLPQVAAALDQIKRMLSIASAGLQQAGLAGMVAGVPGSNLMLAASKSLGDFAGGVNAAFIEQGAGKYLPPPTFTGGSSGLPGGGGTPGGGGGSGGKGGGGKGGGGGKEVDAIKEMADITQQVSQAVTQGLETIAKLAHVVIPENLKANVDALATAINTVMQSLQKVALSYKVEALNLISAFASTSSDVFGALQAAFSFFQDIAKDGDAVLHGPTALAALSAELVKKIVIIVNVLGGMIPLWSQFASDKISSFATASQAVFGGLQSALDFFRELVKDGPAVINGPVALASLSSQMVEKIVIIMNVLGGMIPLWDDFGSNKIKVFSEATQAVFGGLSTALDFFRELVKDGPATINGPVMLASLAVQLSEKIVIVMNVLGAAIPLWDDFASTKITAFAQATQAVFGGLSAAFDFFTTLAELGQKVLNGPAALASLAVQLSEKIVIVMNTLGGMIPLWDSFADTKISQFGQATGTVFQGLSTALGFFVDIAQVAKTIMDPSLDLGALGSRLAEKLVYVMNTLGAAIPLWDDFATTKISAFGNASKAVFDGLASGLAVLNGMATLDVLPSQGVMDIVVAHLVGLVDTFRTQVLGVWVPEALALTAQLATDAGTIVQGIGAGLGVLKDLADPKLVMPSQEAILALFASLSQVIFVFGWRSKEWAATATIENANLAGYVGTMVSGVGQALDLLVGLQTFTKALDPGNVLLFFDALDKVISAFASKSAAWTSKATPDIATLATNVGTVMGALGSAVDPILKIMGFTMPGAEAGTGPGAAVAGGFLQVIHMGPAPMLSGIEAFFMILNVVLTRFAQLSEEWKKGITDEVAHLGANIATVMGGVNAAIEPILKMAETQKITPEQIEGSMANIWTALHHFQNVMAGLPAGFIDQASIFATGITTVFSGVATALGVLGDMAGTGADGATGFGNVMNMVKEGWMKVFGPKDQEGTLLNMLFRKDELGFFTFLESQLAATFIWEKYEVWGAAMQDLSTFLTGWITSRLRESISQPLYDHGYWMASRIADGIKGGYGLITAALEAICSQTGGGGGGGDKPPSDTPPPPDPMQDPPPRRPAGRGAGTDGTMDHPVIINGDVVLQNSDLHRHFTRALPHKQIRSRGPEIGTEGVY